jgi:hypothetical protein
MEAATLYDYAVQGEKLTARPLPEPEPVDKPAGVYRLKLPTLKVKDGSAVSMVFRYFPDAPTYDTLAEERQGLGLVLHTPTLLDTDWSNKWGWPDYKAEAEIFLPGYNSSTSQVRVSANGKHLGPYVTSDGRGGIARLRFFLPKSEGVEKVRFEVRYRPDDRFDKDYILNFTVPETEATSEDNDPRVSGP